MESPLTILWCARAMVASEVSVVISPARSKKNARNGFPSYLAEMKVLRSSIDAAWIDRRIYANSGQSN